MLARLLATAVLLLTTMTAAHAQQGSTAVTDTAMTTNTDSISIMAGKTAKAAAKNAFENIAESAARTAKQIAEILISV